MAPQLANLRGIVQQRKTATRIEEGGKAIQNLVLHSLLEPLT